MKWPWQWWRARRARNALAEAVRRGRDTPRPWDSIVAERKRWESIVSSVLRRLRLAGEDPTRRSGWLPCPHCGKDLVSMRSPCWWSHPERVVYFSCADCHRQSRWDFFEGFGAQRPVPISLDDPKRKLPRITRTSR